jgi:hypothetical protein
MGSFDVGCGLSNLAIHEGDEAAFVLLSSPSPLRRGLAGARRTHIYSDELYRPFLPPVYGHYDDYGRLASLKESATTRLLEKRFNRPAEAVVNAIGQGRGIYDTYGEIFDLYMPPAVKAALEGYPRTLEEKLEAVGFSKVKPQKGYALAYSYREYTLSLKASAGGKASYLWRVTSPTGAVLKDTISPMGEFDRLMGVFRDETHLLPGYLEEDWSRVDLLASLSGMFFLPEVFHEVRNYLGTEVLTKMDRERLEEELERVFTIIGDAEATGPSRGAGSRLRESLRDSVFASSLPALTWLGAYREVREELMELFELQWVATSLNRLLQPSLCGEQHGNDEASELLNQVEAKILKRRRMDVDTF